MNQVDALIGLTHHALTITDRSQDMNSQPILPDGMVGRRIGYEVQFADGARYRVAEGIRGKQEVCESQEVENTLHVWVR